MRSKKLLFISIALLAFLALNNAFSQVVTIGVNTTGAAPDSSAILDVSSVNRGFLMPRMTTVERGNITSPAEGLLIFNTTTKCYEAYVNGSWNSAGCPCTSPGAAGSITGSATVCKSQNGVAYSITAVSGATGYVWSLPSGASIASGANTNSITVNFSGTATSGNISVYATNGCGNGASSPNFAVTVNSVPATPTAGSHVPSQTQIVWNWNTVSGATGYQWNTSTTYPGVGVNTVASPTYTQTGLTCNTAYTFYAWAYNSCGNSATSVSLSQTTSACSGWVCGDPIVVNHVAGTVSPLTKTISYGTFTSSLSGSSRCWISQNLGAEHYATSATADMTDESAGWYWQFNRKQGYEPNPTAVIPAGFLGSINETIDWTAANDPCTILLGAGWRIPTYTEWLNTETNAGWANVSQAYASSFKLHLGGNVNAGNLTQRGGNGLFWVSTSATATASYTVFETAANSYVTGGTMGKTYGYSLRCLQ